MADTLTITGDQCEDCCVCNSPSFSFTNNPVVLPTITANGSLISGCACGACTTYVNMFVNQFGVSGPHTVTTPALGAKLFCNGVEITSGVAWQIDAPQQTFNYGTGAYDSGSLPGCPRSPNFLNNVLMTDNRFGEASCGADSSIEEEGLADIKGTFTVNSPSSPNTTFTWTDIYARYGATGGDWGGYIRVRATFLGVTHTAWVLLTLHADVTAVDCDP